MNNTQTLSSYLTVNTRGIHYQDKEVEFVQGKTTVYSEKCTERINTLYWPKRWVTSVHKQVVDCVWNVMAHAQKPDFFFRRNGRVHLNRQGRQFSRLLADDVCASAVVMLDAPCSDEVWRVLATHSIRQFPLHFPSRASPCAITFQLDSTVGPIC
jgi:hypothetical protein